MATNTFISNGANITASGYTTIYTAPTATQVVLVGLSFANTYTASITINIQITKSGGSSYYLGYQIPIPQGSSFALIGDGQKVVLQAGDLVKAQVVTASGTADCVASYLTIS
jgi:hypothetical protein